MVRRIFVRKGGLPGPENRTGARYRRHQSMVRARAVAVPFPPAIVSRYFGRGHGDAVRCASAAIGNCKDICRISFGRRVGGKRKEASGMSTDYPVSPRRSPAANRGRPVGVDDRSQDDEYIEQRITVGEVLTIAGVIAASLVMLGICLTLIWA